MIYLLTMRTLLLVAIALALPQYTVAQEYVPEALIQQDTEVQDYTFERMNQIAYEAIILTKFRLSLSGSNLANSMTIYDEEYNDTYTGQFPVVTKREDGSFNVTVHRKPETNYYVNSAPFPESLAGDPASKMPSVELPQDYSQMKLEKYVYDGAVNVLRMTNKMYSLSTGMMQN